MKKPRLAVAILDNGMGLSSTHWGRSMFRAAIAGAFDEWDVMITGISYPYPAGGMNIATHEFMKSDCERMLIIDTDEEFEPRHVKWLLSHSEPYVNGMYPKKKPGLEFPVELIEDGGEPGTSPFAVDPLADGVEPLVEVARCARGFLSVHRSAFELVRPKCGEYLDAHSGEVHVEYWKGQPGGGSEDYNFCDLYRSMGGKVLIDQRCVIFHWGPCKFPIPDTFLNPKLTQPSN